MSDQPLVSVVIPCYNHEQFVQDCIQSVIDQTYQNIELIIIDDGSNDGSVAKIEEMVDLCEKRFTHFEFRHRSNKGLSATLNEAIEWCQGEYYSCIASDDQMLNYKTEKQVEYLKKNTNCVACFGGYILIDEENREIHESKKKQKSYSFEDILLLNHELPAPTQMIHLETLRGVGGYSPDIIIEDWYMWLKLGQISNLIYLPIILSKYRSHNGNTYKQVEKMYNGRKKIIQAYVDQRFYNKIKLKIQWLKYCEQCQLDRKEALLRCKSFIKEDYFRIFNLNFLRFIYWYIFK